MEWLINRRRMMFNKVIPIEYFEFADEHINKIVSYFYGDTQTITNTNLETGTVTGNNNTPTEIIIYADNRCYPARTTSKGASVSKIDNRTVNYRLYVDNIWDIDSTTSASSEDEVFSLSAMQTYKSNAYTTIESVVGSSWANQSIFTYDSSLNKWYLDFQAGNRTVYIKIVIRAKVGETVNWELFVKEDSVVYKPLGITRAQMEAVTTFTIAGAGASQRDIPFFYNPYISSFDEFQYFSNCTSIAGNYGAGNGGGFRSCENLTSVVLPENMTSIGDMGFQNCPITSINTNNVTYVGRYALYNTRITSLYLPKLVSTGKDPFNSGVLTYLEIGEDCTSIGNLAVSNAVIVCRATTPPTINYSPMSCKALYVPADSVDAYKAATYWSNAASKTYAIEGSYYENHHELDPNQA